MVDYVELHDTTRDFTVRLTRDAMWLQQGRGREMARFYEGSWIQLAK